MTESPATRPIGPTPKLLWPTARRVWLADLPMAGGPTVADGRNPPFSFVYGGRPSSEFLKNWKVARASQQLDPQRTQWTVTYTDPTTGLIVRAIGIEYRDFPTVEWTLHFTNSGRAATPILENIQALDMRFAKGHYGEFLLHNAVGSPCAPQRLRAAGDPLAAER